MTTVVEVGVGLLALVVVWLLRETILLRDRVARLEGRLNGRGA